MSESSAAPPSVGSQLARRRKELDIPQGTLAQMASVTVTSISKAENDRVAIRRGKRGDWERALRLKAGTISRAYETGSPIEPLEAPERQVRPRGARRGQGAPYADMTDPYERVIWDMKISEADRRTLIDLLRSDRQEGRRPA